MAQQGQRFSELEGLRGMAAVAVAIYHFSLAFFAVAFLGVLGGAATAHSLSIEKLLYGNPIMVFLSGAFAVAIFFVLSGFVLSIGFFQTGKLEIVKKLAIKRYPRLMLPALASIIVAYLLMKFGISHIQQAAAYTQSMWLVQSWAFPPHIFEAIWGGIIEIFKYTGNPYNNVLWTMHTEFVGSFIVFGFLALFGKSTYRPLLYGLLLVLFLNTWFMPFVAGMVLADCYANGLLKQKQRSWLVVPVMVLALFLAGYPESGSINTVYQYLAIQGTSFNYQAFYVSLGAILFVGVVLVTSQVAQFFRKPIISRLGKYTFSLYLIHLLVLYSFTTIVFTFLMHHTGLGISVAAVIAMVGSIPLVVVATYLFEKYVDAPSIRLSNWLAAMVMHQKELSLEFIEAYKKAYKRAYEKVQRVTDGVTTEEVELSEG